MLYEKYVNNNGKKRNISVYIYSLIVHKKIYLII